MWPTNTRVRYLGETWNVLGQGAQYVVIVNERTGRLLEVMPDLLEVCR